MIVYDLRNVISDMLAFLSQWPLKPGKVSSRGTEKFKYTTDIILQDEKKKVKRELFFGATSVHCIEKRFSGVLLSPLSQLKFTEIFRLSLLCQKQ